MRSLLERLRAQVEALAAAMARARLERVALICPAMMLLDEALVERRWRNVVANVVEHAPVGSSVMVDVRADVSPPVVYAERIDDIRASCRGMARRRGCERFLLQGDAASRGGAQYSGLGFGTSPPADSRAPGGSVELANRSVAEAAARG